MNSTERVRNLILGKPVDRQPIYGWVRANLDDKISECYGSSDAFEDKYEFDMAHIFAEASPFNKPYVATFRNEDGEVLPEDIVDKDFFNRNDIVDVSEIACF